MKFGGSSVQDASRIRDVVSIILPASSKTSVAVVVSAMRGVTDKLILAGRGAERGDSGYKEQVREIALRQLFAVGELFAGSAGGPRRSAGHELAADLTESGRPWRASEMRAYRGAGEATLGKQLDILEELEELLTGIELVRECTPRSLDLVMSAGERLSCILIADYINSLGHRATYLDAREFIRTDGTHGHAEVDFDESYPAIRARVSASPGLPIITGFIGSSRTGATTTLGRDGSDYTASIVGAALGSEVIEIWTDVDGVMSADPRFVKEAFVIPEMSFQDAMELSYFGAKVIHPSTMIPAVELDIPILIKNTLNPTAPGTLISRNSVTRAKEITGIASIENVALINVEGGGMIGVPGIASRVFQALARASINVIMISQASSEHSICLVCRAGEAEAAIHSLHQELAREIETRRIQEPQLATDLEIIAIIGEKMRGTPGISGKLFSALGGGGINVLAIAQGSSERNISFVIERKNKLRALNVIHGAFLGTEAAR